MVKKNKLVISVDFRETRVALIEDGIIAELHLERSGHTAGQTGTVGNVYLGKVTRVLPGLQAAFIDIGQERAAFLHVEDLIRPDDFEAYLAGSRKSAAMAEETATEAAAAAATATADAAPALPAAAVETTAPESSPADAAPAEAEAGAATEADAEVEPERAKIAVRRRSRRPPAAEAAPEPVAEPEVEEVEEVGEAVPAVASSLEVDPDWSTRSLDDDGSDDEEGPDSDDDEADEDEGSDDEDEGPDSDDDDESDDDDDVDSGDEVAEAKTAPSMEDTVALSAADLSEMTLAALTGGRRPAGGSRPASGAGGGDRDRGAGPRTDAKKKPAPQLDLDDLPGFTITDPGDPVPPPPTTSAREDDPRRGGGRRGRGRKGSGRGPAGGNGGGGGGGGGSREGGRSREGNRGGPRRGGDSDNMHSPLRISKSTPIRDVVKEGQEILVQVSKDPIGTKGARCTSHVSLPGRYVVYLPTVDHVGVSKRIGSEKERGRLREAIIGMKPPSGGFIVRTVAEGLTKKGLKQDVGYLVHLWGDVAKKREGARAPALLSSELDLVLKTARDLFTDEVQQIVIDDKHQHERLCRFLEMFAPERVKDVVLYNGEEPIFDAYGIEDEIQRALSRKVPLPSGGHLIIDQAEALTAIDVNTGRFVGKGSKDMEETILQTNLEAVNEIAYQLRFRNIGGLIILDLIDMERAQNREKVRRTLEDLLQKDKAKTTLNRISDLGLIEMTRKRTRESLGRLLHEPCFYCDGTGQLQSKETIALEILRDIRRKVGDMPGYTISINAHPAVCDLLNTSARPGLTEAENRYLRKITVTPRKDYHLEQFDIQGK